MEDKNKLNSLSATTATYLNNPARRAEMVSVVQAQDDYGSYESSSEDGIISRQFNVPEARDFILSKLRDQEWFEDCLNRFVEWDDIVGLNEKADLTAVAKTIMRQTRWYGIYRATREEIQAADLLRRRHLQPLIYSLACDS